MMSYHFFNAQHTPNLDWSTWMARHQASPFRLPISKNQHLQFEHLLAHINHPQKIILDWGCGRGDSTLHLGTLHPEALVIGIDRSHARLERNAWFKKHQKPSGLSCHQNVILMQANIEPMALLFQKHLPKVHQQYFFYPNPYPKHSHQSKRLYAHPISFVLHELSDQIEVRSNWLLYLEEWQAILNAWGWHTQCQRFHPNLNISAFEAKYSASQTPIYQLLASQPL